MNFEKSSEVSIPREMLQDFVAAQLYAMRLVPQGAEIEFMEGNLTKTPHISIKFKMKKED